ncbi:hypothetical protein ACPPVU_08485 [Mucilaginibacter sp. McL0603]|uniref:hypothetical protein n=1 Tax=Mucilaginibacter sp. McL0603 TaxID=3415670 RepID=UPI003CE8753E
MNKLSYLFMICMLVSVLTACQKGDSNSISSDAALIVGKWNLQQQKTVQYVNDVRRSDTTIITTADINSNVQFEKNGKFINVSFRGYNDVGSGSSGAGERDSTFGTYSVANSSLILSPSYLVLLGFYDGLIPLFFAGDNPLPTVVMISDSSQINTLTSSKLTLHTEYIYSETINNITTIYKDELDYYYTK